MLNLIPTFSHTRLKVLSIISSVVRKKSLRYFNYTKLLKLLRIFNSINTFPFQPIKLAFVIVTLASSKKLNSEFCLSFMDLSVFVLKSTGMCFTRVYRAPCLKQHIPNMHVTAFTGETIIQICLTCPLTYIRHTYRTLQRVKFILINCFHLQLFSLKQRFPVK